MLTFAALSVSAVDCVGSSLPDPLQAVRIPSVVVSSVASVAPRRRVRIIALERCMRSANDGRDRDRLISCDRDTKPMLLVDRMWIDFAPAIFGQAVHFGAME